MTPGLGLFYGGMVSAKNVSEYTSRPPTPGLIYVLNKNKNNQHS
jgi:ammonia channel protein AmtB